jgi:O-antigen/teichoic acid export membrane protein
VTLSTTPAQEPAPSAPEATGAIARNAVHLVLGQVGTTALAVLLAAALGRWLGAADFGLYYLVTSTSAFAYVLVEWGQAQLIVREVARAPDRAASLLGTALALRVAGSLLVAVLAALAFVVLRYDWRTGQLAVVFIGTSLPFFLAQAYGLVFRGRERMDLDAAVSVVNKVLVLALTLAAFAMGAGLLGAILAQAVAGLGALAVAAMLLPRLGVPRLSATLARARDLLIGGTPIVAMSLATAAQSYADVVVLSKLAPAEAVGWFGAARNIFGTIAAASFILGSAAFPRLSRAAGNHTAFRQELETALRPLFGLAGLAAVGSYLFADVAVAIVFGSARFGPAGPIIQASAPGQVLLFVDVLLAGAIIASGRARSLALAKALTIPVTVGLELLLIPYFQERLGNGGIGVVVAFFGSEAAMLVAASRLLPRGTLRKPLLLDAARALLASAGTLVLFRAIPPVTPALGIPLCVLTFAGLATAVGLIRRAEMAGLVGLLRRGPRA